MVRILFSLHSSLHDPCGRRSNMYRAVDAQNRMMRVLRELNYKGYLDTEMGTSTTPEAAMQLTRKMSLEN